MATQTFGIKSFVAGEDILAYRRVKINSSGQAVYADAEAGIGIAQGNYVTGELVAVKLNNAEGTQVAVLVDASASTGDTVYAAADGKVSTTANAYPVGTLCEAATVANSELEISLLNGSQVRNSETHKVVAAGIHDWAGGAATTDSISVVGLLATDIVSVTLVARAATETLVLAANDAANDQIDLTLSANGTNTTTKLAYSVMRAL
jgi:hypothetical protein